MSDPYLLELARRMDELQDREEISDALDKLEFMYDTLDEQQQDIAGEFITRLQHRLRALGD
jgi:hypothetical protein